MKRPLIIAVAGPGSNSGKTHLACGLIGLLGAKRPVGAVKIATSTPDHLCARTNLPCDCLKFDGKMRLLTDPGYINKTGKDTALLFEAGARPVWWLQTTADVQHESTLFLQERLEGPAVWVMEGSGPIRSGIADLAIVVARADDREPKESWYNLLPRADILAVSHHGAISDESFESPEGLRPDVPIVNFSGTSMTLSEELKDAVETFLKNHAPSSP